MSRSSHRQMCCSLFLLASLCIIAQAQKTPEPTPNPDEGKATELLKSIAGRVPSLQSSGNRIVVGCSVADLLWDRDEKQARDLFEVVMKDVASQIAELDFSDQDDLNRFSLLQQSRQRVLETIARHDGALALTFLRSTRPQFSGDKSNNPLSEQERNLELNLATVAMARNPEFALKVARASLQRGIFHGHVSVLQLLQQKDPATARQFYGEIVDRFAGNDLPQNPEIFNVGWNLVRAFQPPTVKEDVFRRLVESLAMRVLAINPTDATRIQLAQNLYHQMRWSLQSIEKFAPMRASALQEWSRMVERSFDASTRMYTELNELSQQGSIDDILAMKARYPDETHMAINQQAVWKALNSNDYERAKQLAKDISDPMQRQQLLAQIEQHLALKAAGENRVADARRSYAKIKQPEQRIQVMMQLAANLASKGDKDGAIQILNEARSFLETLPTSEQKLMGQLQLIRSYCLFEPQQAEAMLQPFIAQVNQLVAAAVVLDGFDSHYLQEGEWSAQNFYGVNTLVNTLDQILGVLAAKQWQTAQTLTEQIERPEIRLFAQLAIVQSVLEPNNRAAMLQPTVMAPRRFVSYY